MARHDAAARDGYPHALWGAWAQTPPSKGDGKVGNPYIITTAEELAWFRDQVNSGNNFICAKISEDVEVIDMSTVCHAEDKSQNLIEKSWEPIGKNDYGYQYQGTFDGNGKTITNLYINASQNNVGLFGYTYEGTIKNLTFEYANVTNTGVFTGFLVGYANTSKLQNIKISNTCQMKGGKETGGIAGDFDGNAYNCVNYAMVQGNNRVGGLFGYCSVENSSITTCANYGNVTATSTDAGGLVGYFISGTIQDCANYGDVKGTGRVAGMAGFVSEGKIQNVFNYGNISATNSTDAGMAFGNSYKGATTEGMVAYYSGAKLIANGQEITIKAFGNGKPSEDNATGFTEAQLRSGEVAWLLNGSTSVPTEGSTLTWYQKLSGTDADAYPVLTAAEGNTVYHGSFRYCDGTTSSYSNSSSDSELIHVASATLTIPEFDSAKHIYHMGCRNESCTEHKYVADADGTLEATKSTDGKFYVKELNLTDASTAINTQAQFVVKDLQYIRQLTEGQTGYVTLCLPFDINVADVAGAENCYPVGNMMIHMPTDDASLLKFVLMLDEQSVIKANTPMVVKLAAENAAQKLVAMAQNVEYSANFFTNPAAKSLTLRDWDDKTSFMPICHDLASASIGGVYATTPMAEGSYSFRADGKFGIHTGNLSPYRIYLNIQASQLAPSHTMLFSIGLPDDSSTTGIRIIGTVDDVQSGSSVKSAAIYTLNGQRVTGTPRKGIYIKNGKKIIVK